MAMRCIAWPQVASEGTIFHNHSFWRSVDILAANEVRVGVHDVNCAARWANCIGLMHWTMPLSANKHPTCLGCDATCGCMKQQDVHSSLWNDSGRLWTSSSNCKPVLETNDPIIAPFPTLPWPRCPTSSQWKRRMLQLLKVIPIHCGISVPSTFATFFWLDAGTRTSYAPL